MGDGCIPDVFVKSNSTTGDFFGAYVLYTASKEDLNNIVL